MCTRISGADEAETGVAVSVLSAGARELICVDDCGEETSSTGTAFESLIASGSCSGIRGAAANEDGSAALARQIQMPSASAITAIASLSANFTPA